MSVWVFAGLIVTGAWTQLDEIGWAGWLAPALVFGLERYAVTGGRERAGFPAMARGVPVFACVALCLLHLAHVGVTAREEFGFGGDEGYHLSATRAFALYYMRAGPILAAVVALLTIWRWKAWPYAVTAATCALLAGSYALPASPLFGRYPAGFYLLAAPLNVLFDVAAIPYPHAANHIVNALSLPAWLFLLRPLIIGRWPDWQVLPAALLLYFQAPSFTFMASTLIEPWSLVFALLAVEALVTLPSQERWRAVLLGAIATWFKETAIFLLPTLWLLACVEWRGFRPSLRPHAIAVGIAAVAPFVAYYLVRRGAQIHRTVAIASAAEIWQPARLDLWLTNITAQIGVTGLISVVLVALAIMRQWLWVLTAAGLVLFFFVDALGVPYTGYGRYQAFTLLALAGGLFAMTHRAHGRRVVIALSLAMAVLQALPVAQVLALDLRPDHARNSLEWNGSLIRLPIRQLAERVAALNGGEHVRTVRVLAANTDLISLRVVYPDLAKQYDLRGEPLSPDADCVCRDNTEAVLAVFEWPAHFGDTPAARASFAALSAACVSQIETTCVSKAFATSDSGAVVGALGLRRMLLLATPQDHEPAKR